MTVPRRRYLLPPPASVEGILSRPLHVVLRDYPETLVVLERLGVRPEEDGGAPVARLPNAEAVAGAILKAARWRPEPEDDPS